MKRRYQILSGLFTVALAAILLYPQEVALRAQEAVRYLQAVEIHRGRLFLGKSINLEMDGATVDTSTTTLTVTDPTAARTFTLPDQTVNLSTTQLPANTGGIPTVYYAGNTSGSASSAISQVGTAGKMFFGVVTLSAGSASVDSLSPAFTATDEAACTATYANGNTGVASPIAYLTTTSKVLIGGTGSAKVAWSCGGL